MRKARESAEIAESQLKKESQSGQLTVLRTGDKQRYCSKEDKGVMRMVRKLDWEHPKRESEGWIGKWKSF